MSEFYPSSEESDDDTLHGHICVLINDTFTRADLIRDFLKDRNVSMLVFNKNATNINLINSLAYEFNKPSMFLPFNYNNINECVNKICKHANELCIFHDGYSNASQLEDIGNAVGNEGMPVFMIQCSMVDPRTGLY